MEQLEHFLMGATAMACAVAGLFFLRFWRRTRDRFFLMFALAFWALSGVRVALLVAAELDESRAYIYLFRLLAFLLILAAIVDKNRAAGGGNAEGD